MMKIEIGGREYTAAEIIADMEAREAQAAHNTAVGPPPAPPSPQATFTPTPGQIRAVERVAEMMRNPDAAVMAIVGYAGVGKTTMLKLLAEVHGAPLVVCPTGKAALRVQETTGLEASTIHRWLYMPVDDPKTGRTRFERRKDGDFKIPFNRLLLIDEASMVSRELWDDLWRAAKSYKLRVVCVGDGFQLPPVQDKNVAPFSLLDPSVISNRVELTEVLRQAQDSTVVRASMKLRDGMGVLALGELDRVDRNTLMDVARATREAGGVVICATNATRFKVNSGMREHIGNPYPQPGEPLLVLRNNYDFDAYNGEQLNFEGWTVPPDEPSRVRDRYTGKECDVMYGEATVDGRPAILCVEELHGNMLSNEVGGLALSIGAEAWAREHNCWVGGKVTPFLQANFGYAYTAHKSQGSEWPFALVMLEPNIKLDTEDGRRWAYTAVTRAKTQAAVFYGRI